MKVDTNVFLASISEKKIYYFSSSKINSPEQHYYICLKRTDNDILILSCCTSKFETISNFIEKRNLPHSTLVWIKPQLGDDDNPFTKDTYVNCNNHHTFTLVEFKIMYESNNISYSGKIDEIHYEQILIGIHASTIIEKETKDLIPLPDSL